MITLAIMAKADAPTVLRAIASAAHLVDEVCLVVAPGDPLVGLRLPIPGRIVEEPWRGFGATRTATLRHAESNPDTRWVVMIDADDEFAAGGELPDLRASDAVDAYSIPIDLLFHGGHWRWYQSGHLMRAGVGAYWEGALHEVCTLPAGGRWARWGGLSVCADQRRQPTVRAGGRTYHDDSRALAARLASYPDDSRAAFYYAQSLKDTRRWRESYDAFLRRAAMPSSNREETFWAFLWAAKIAPFVPLDQDAVVRAHLDAHAHSPSRAEPLHELGLYYKGRGDDERARHYASLAARLPYPEEASSFVDVNAYSSRPRGSSSARKDIGT